MRLCMRSQTVSPWYLASQDVAFFPSTNLALRLLLVLKLLLLGLDGREQLSLLCTFLVRSQTRAGTESLLGGVPLLSCKIGVVSALFDPKKVKRGR